MASSSTDKRADAAAAAETAVSHVYQAARSRMKSLAGRFHPDLQPVGYGILRIVLDQEGVRAADIATTLGMDKSAVSRQVALLREMGLVDSEQDPVDGRATQLIPSAEARSGLAAFRSESSSEFGRIFTDWSTDDIVEFSRLLAKFNASI